MTCHCGTAGEQTWRRFAAFLSLDALGRLGDCFIGSLPALVHIGWYERGGVHHERREDKRILGPIGRQQNQRRTTFAQRTRHFDELSYRI